jgi:tRNA-dihydrouridine synthase
MLDTMIDLRPAPMAAVTNTPFRLVCRECGAGPLTNEELDARALLQGSARTVEMSRFLPEERPIAMQLLGSDPDVLAEAARRLEAAGADAIDLNMGCPVAKIVGKGQGAALMRDPLGAAVILRTMRKAIGIRFTVKIRGGWDERTVNAVEIARVAESEGVDAITVHPRTRSQQYAGVARYMQEIVAQAKESGEVRTLYGRIRKLPDLRSAARRKSDVKWMDADPQDPKSIWWLTKKGKYVGLRVVRLLESATHSIRAQGGRVVLCIFRLTGTLPAR